MMQVGEIESFAGEELFGQAQKNALELAAYLRASEMLFVRGKGYWEDKLYWMVKYQGEYVCFILIDGHGEKGASWTVWSDDSGSDWFKDFPLDEDAKEIAWRHVDFCAGCGGDCSPGATKTIFGRVFDNVCRTAIKFENPDAAELQCLKKLIEARKNDISKNI